MLVHYDTVGESGIHPISGAQVIDYYIIAIGSNPT